MKQEIIRDSGELVIIEGRLSPAFVRNIKEPDLYLDAKGLCLEVKEGSRGQIYKNYVLRFMLAGRSRKMGIGPTWKITLGGARRRAAKVRLLLHDGIDPIEAGRTAEAERKVKSAKASTTFGQVASAFIDAKRGGWGAVHLHQWTWTFIGADAPTRAINGMPVAMVDQDAVLGALKSIWTKTPETAKRVQERIATVLDAATARGLREGQNPAGWDILKHSLPARRDIAPTVHHPALPWIEVPGLMSRLRAVDDIRARALEFTILTVARAGEVLHATWDEIDLDAKLWVISAARMKATREHRVPLSPRALAILHVLPRDGALLFPSPETGRAHFTAAMLKVLRRLHADVTVHGMRSAFRDWAGEQSDASPDTIELSLAHAVGSGVERSYRRGDLFEKRRILMQQWDRFCAQPPVADAKVADLGEKRAAKKRGAR